MEWPCTNLKRGCQVRSEDSLRSSNNKLYMTCKVATLGTYEQRNCHAASNLSKLSQRTKKSREYFYKKEESEVINVNGWMKNYTVSWLLQV